MPQFSTDFKRFSAIRLFSDKKAPPLSRAALLKRHRPRGNPRSRCVAVYL